MRRREWFEIHDQPRYPNSLRDFVTDTLQFVWNFFGLYDPIVPRLRSAVLETGTSRIVGLCSGGGGPWLGFVRNEDEDFVLADIYLTDKSPNFLKFGFKFNLYFDFFLDGSLL